MIQDYSDNKGQHKALKKKSKSIGRKIKLEDNCWSAMSNDKSGQLINNTKRQKQKGKEKGRMMSREVSDKKMRVN